MFSCPKYWSLEIRIFYCKLTHDIVTNIGGDYDKTDDAADDDADADADDGDDADDADDADADDADEACVATWLNEIRRDLVTFLVTPLYKKIRCVDLITTGTAETTVVEIVPNVRVDAAQR